MSLTRIMTVLLAAIILIKSFDCIIGESLFAPSPGHGLVAASAMLDKSAAPAGPLRPPTGEQGCTDSGCLCNGFVEVPEVTAPEPSRSLDDLLRLTGVNLRRSAGFDWSSPRARLCRPGGDLFADTSPSGRTLRLWIDSLTI